MSVGALISALVVGAVMGALGRFIVRGRQPTPMWVMMAVAVVAALIGSLVARAAGIADSGFGIGEFAIQFALAAASMILVAVTTGRHSRQVH